MAYKFTMMLERNESYKSALRNVAGGFSLMFQ